MPRVWFCVACAFSLLLPGVAAATERPVDFNRDIRPILSNTCFKCHGFDDKERKAGLRLDTLDGQRAELESGEKAVVPGAPDESSLVARVTSDDESTMMPPPGSNKVLTPEQRAKIAELKKQQREKMKQRMKDRGQHRKDRQGANPDNPVPQPFTER